MTGNEEMPTTRAKNVGTVALIVTSSWRGSPPATACESWIGDTPSVYPFWAAESFASAYALTVSPGR